MYWCTVVLCRPQSEARSTHTHIHTIVTHTHSKAHGTVRSSLVSHLSTTKPSPHIYTRFTNDAGWHVSTVFILRATCCCQWHTNQHIHFFLSMGNVSSRQRGRGDANNARNICGRLYCLQSLLTSYASVLWHANYTQMLCDVHIR